MIKRTRKIIGIVIALVMASMLFGYNADLKSEVRSNQEIRKERIKNSPNYEGGRFVNTIQTDLIALEGIGKVVKESLFPDKKRSPSQPLPIVNTDFNDEALSSSLRVIWIGHATTLIEIDSVRLLTDPIFDDFVKHSVGKTKRFQPPAIARDELPAIDAILISHDHYDHLEESSVRFFSELGVKFYIPLGVGTILEEWGVPQNDIIEFDWWESAKFQNLQIIFTPAHHLSGRGISNMNKNLWGSWVVIGSHGRLFYSGDSGYSDHFIIIGDRYGPFDISLMQIGAYGKAWPYIHLFPEEAIIAQQDLNCKLLLPLHWGTFDLALHPWDEPIIRLVEAAIEENLQVVIPHLGEVVKVSETKNQDYIERWWEGIE